jgi:flagellar L-ring protein precursor FlgH
MDRARKRGGKFGLLGGLGGVLGTAEGEANAEIGVSSSRGYDGSTATSIEREFIDRITARIVDVRPNGDMRVEGYRRQLVSHELRELRVTGWIRPWDIRADNSVESRQVADFCLEYRSSGEETDFTRLGWLTRSWQKVRP